ncbi:TonB-dependent receptor [Chitinophaga polysaccharea]|uniref:TonB-dependent receptor n=1 Tax=Chitinophaga polysaccharea TaxID=1293035 RepID=UPI001455BF9D|nr:TonB-dependent receptor [Chitinophaga polysaccharea]NLR58308.1 TonB-dependent receptor [Chitinophaga polysaccharea]
MRISFYVIVLVVTATNLMASVTTKGQSVERIRMSVDIHDLPLRTALEEISARSGVRIYFNDEKVDKIKHASFRANNAPLLDILAGLLMPANMVAQLYADNRITVMPLLPPVKGTVTDKNNGTPLPGVGIRIKGQSAGAITDANGHFSITIPDEGAVLVVTYIGYQPQEIKVAGGATTLQIALKPSRTQLNEVQVQARRKANTEAAVLAERKASAIVQDAISAANIEKTASITTTQALQRVSGVTITDDKYVAVRGLGDRSVIGQLNGVRLASSDPDRSAIPLDLVPAALLENITIYKTYTPDKPADAAAGIIELKTKSVPDSATLNITAQSGFNSNIGMGGQVNSFYNSDPGFFGQKVKQAGLSSDFTALGKQYPGGFAQVQSMIANSGNDPAIKQEVNRINGIMHGFDPVLTTHYANAKLNQIYGITYGNSFQVFKRHKLGVIAGVNYYQRSTDIHGGDLTQWSIYQGVLTGNNQVNSTRIIPNYITPNNINLGKYISYKENTGTSTLNYGFLGGLTYRFNPRNEISVQYMGSRGAEVQATNLYGAYEYTGLSGAVSNTVYSLKRSYRTLNTFNLQGEHKLATGEYAPKLSYNMASSTSGQEDPDYRFVNLAVYHPLGGGSIPVNGSLPGSTGSTGTPVYYSLVSGYVNGYGPYGIIQADPNGRRYRQLKETNYNYKADLAWPFRLFRQKQEFKGGVNYLHRDRTFNENVLSLPGSNFSSTGNQALYNVHGNLDRLVGYDQIGVKVPTGAVGEGQPAVGGFLYNAQKSPNNYKGSFETRAFYGMLDLHLLQNLRVTGGVRFEMTDIRAAVDTAGVFLDPSLTTPNKDGQTVKLVFTQPNSMYKTDYKPYYSLNLTYTLQENMNFRLGYSTTLARPELREITNVFEFDPFQFALVVGNPKLVNQQTTNYDFRWEWFPNSGEVIAASAFYKQIDHQLTKVYSQNSAGLDARFPEFPAIRFENDPNRGQVYGVELEVVKNLGRWWYPLKNFYLGSNLLLAQSEIKKSPERLNDSRIVDRKAPSNSPLFEQAPYSINAYLNYNNPRTRTDLTVTFNEVGERLIQINLTGEPDLYSRPAPVLDFVFSQYLTRRLQLKGYAKNILNPAWREVYANPGTGGKYYGNTYIRRSYYRGTEFMLGLNYNIF